MAVSKFDVFFAVAAKGQIQESELKQFLNVHDDLMFNQDINFLITDKLLERDGSLLIYPAKNPNAALLFDVLSFTSIYDINYNNYISSPMLIFLEQTYNQNFFRLSDVMQQEEQKRINISVLRKNGFLLIMEESPFRGKVIQNSFLDIILKLHRRAIAPTDKKRKALSVEAMLMEAIMKKQMNAKFGGSMSAPKPEVSYYEVDDPLKGFFLNLSNEQKAIKNILAVHNKEALNLTFSENLQKATVLMRQNVAQKIRVSFDIIVDYHKLLMKDPAIGGVFRTEPVVIAGNPNFKVCPFPKVKEQLHKLIDKYNKSKFKGLPDVIKFGAYLHNELQHIHPFIDGNSRLTRLVMEHFFYLYGLPGFEIPVAYISRYSAITKGAKKRDDNKLFELLKEVFLYMLCNKKI